MANEVVAICYCGMVTAEARESTCFRVDGIEKKVNDWRDMFLNKVEFRAASLWFDVSKVSFDSQMHLGNPQ